jgi:hypothetical protein
VRRGSSAAAIRLRGYVGQGSPGRCAEELSTAPHAAQEGGSGGLVGQERGPASQRRRGRMGVEVRSCVAASEGFVALSVDPFQSIEAATGSWAGYPNAPAPAMALVALGLAPLAPW